MQNLIQSHGGPNPINGLLVRSYTCVVYDNDTLEILNTTHTHNSASELATDAYSTLEVDALHVGLSFHDESLNARSIIGMKLNQFEDFVDNYPNHPLCANS
jgi:hypothetical protein